MVTTSARAVSLSSHSLGTRPADELLRSIEAADEVVLNLNRSFVASVSKILLLAAALSRRERQIRVVLPDGGATDSIRESSKQTLLEPLVLGANSDRTEAFSSSSVGVPEGGYVDRERRLFCVPTELLDRRDRETFRSDLAKWFRAAAIALPPAEFDRVVALGYEANTNSAEHGSTRQVDEGILDSRPVFRCLSARLHDEPGPALPDDANAYVREYSQAFRSRTRWLEMNVVDAGMGLAYPSFLVRARHFRSRCKNVYEAGFEAETGQFAEVLSRRISTKGHWGNVQSTASVTGEGIPSITKNIIRLRGFASIRAGRCAASLSAARVVEPSERTVGIPEYRIQTQERAFFGGTAWQLLLPLDQQISLAL
ncbi:MAG: hypothetical protein ABI601_06450 [bacterium]